MKNQKPLPYLQFAVMGVLTKKKLPGREIRRELERLGVKKAGPAFYRLMARMEEATLIDGWYEQEVVEGQIFRERVYKALPAGLQAWMYTRDFHTAVIRHSSEGRSVSPA